MAFKFESLRVWQMASLYTANVDAVKRRFPQEEKYVLASQIQRAADSVALNIAEGSTGQSDDEFKRFLSYAIRSGIEVISCLHLAKRRNIISPEDFKSLYEDYEKLIVLLQRLRKAI